MEKQESEKTAVKVVEKTSTELENQQEQNPVMEMLQMAMVNSEVDLNKMEKIMEMAERHEAKLAKKSFNRDMALLQGEMPEIKKDGKINDKYGALRSEYASYETIMKAIKPSLMKYGFSASFKPSVKDQKLIVDCVISHRDGHSESTSLELPHDTSGAKNNVQAIGSSMSYAKRYTLCLMFNIPTGGEDNDGNTIVDLPRSLGELTTMTKNANNKSDLTILWNGLSPEEQKIISKVIGARKIELGIVKKS